jgi:hypothetical protein
MSHKAIRLGDSNNFVSIRHIERAGDGAPHAGDVRLEVSVGADGFGGSYDRVWIAAEEWQRFTESLRHLERERMGHAAIVSMSPGEFRLQLDVVDRAGHLQASGHLSRYRSLLSRKTARSRIEYHFDIDPSLLRVFVDSIASLGSPIV